MSANHPKIERRQADRRSSDEDLSPEYLALLDVCGGEIRAGDRAVLSSRRQGLQGGAGDAAGNQLAVVSEPASTVRDRRAPKR
jgi:hypothetical protein